MKKLLLRAVAPVLVGAALGHASVAQVRPQIPQNPSAQPNDSLQVTLELLPDSLVAMPAPIDSARLVWLRTPPQLQDLVGDRVSCFETDVPHAFNASVLAFVRLFTERQRSYTQRVLERENMYFPLFEKYLAKYNLPTDLKYLAVVESALIPTAKSRVGATGLWQFMGPTANDLRLRRDDWVDERMDPEKATEAACKHLRYLYGVFHDWEMVLAAYNWGAGNMQRVMRRTGKKTFWEVYPNLPAETRNYVPTFTAIMYTMKHAQDHQLHDPTLRYQRAELMDTLQLGGRAFDLTRLARACGYPDSMALARLNPELRKPWLPAGYRPYAVQLPAAVRPALSLVDRATLFDYCRPMAELPTPLAPRTIPLLGVTPVPTRSLLADGAPRESSVDTTPRFRRVRHTVRRGETVASVAERYDVTPAQVRRWNELSKSQSLASRRQLVVFVPIKQAPVPEGTAVASTAPTHPALMRAPEKVKSPLGQSSPRIAVASAPAAVAEGATVVAEKTEAPRLAKPARPIRSQASSVAATTPEADDSVPNDYVVRRGDFIEKIARERNLTVAQVMSWNHLTSEVVQPGQKLVLHPTTADQETEATPTVVVASAKPMRAAAPTEPKEAAAKMPAPPKVHLVQPGDTLYNISRRYQGVTVEKLRQLNNLKSDDVKPGQKLLVAG
ncbi:LysM peptidoglycan-binding domain-containing protein [Hymenobacter taeanensis]|uniref:LysM peptidoglycan-binding domain-containing protein n=1 Tax=Hymenobacter taeanensis TaxID=2735321 RepID=A0A6M6BDI0_9BACT|nr:MULTISPECIES: LysM peptidoglycan-binding domain-containing protein [Hymenobacter]QJX46286.1 LysM peptidoglycan-binding domain-containing protein [Hymenobacter taeanensis]UOQ80141.1 LysM peptidoglycan-binding domain-containing protein [Hymenobacter sp. 5414T-23]